MDFVQGTHVSKVKKEHKIPLLNKFLNFFKYPVSQKNNIMQELESRCSK